MDPTDTATLLLERYQQLLHERLVSRRASEDYLYWVRRFLNERELLDQDPTEREARDFLKLLREERLSSSAERRAEVALELLVNELLNESEAA